MDHDLKSQRWLYALLKGDKNIHNMLKELKNAPALLHLVAEKIFPDTDFPELAVVDLVALAVLARTGSEEMPLLPARYHAFARALEGAFVCINKQAHPKDKPRLFLHRHKFCPYCQSRTFELANCTRCGMAYLVGKETPGSILNEEHPLFTRKINNTYLMQDSNLYTSEAARNTNYYVFSGSGTREDEDEVVIGEGNMHDADEFDHLDKRWLCPLCGQIQDREKPVMCDCKTELISVYKIDIGQKSTLKRCVSCSTRSSGGAVFRFLTGQDAPVSVIASALYQQIPAGRGPNDATKPGQGRKMLNFTDSRQNAAFFAPYLERSYMRSFRRGNDSALLAGEPRCFGW